MGGVKVRVIVKVRVRVRAGARVPKEGRRWVQRGAYLAPGYF